MSENCPVKTHFASLYNWGLRPALRRSAPLEELLIKVQKALLTKQSAELNIPRKNW